MPIRTQNPWVDAGAGINNGLGQLVQMYSQLPQIRMQMQQHADQMGIQQGHLQLTQQDQNLHAPLYQAETEHYKANANKENAAAQQLMMLMDFAKQAQAGKYRQKTMGMTGGPTIANGEQQAAAQMLGALAGSSALQPDAAQRALEREQAPLKLNMGQTALSQSGVPFAQGAMRAPYGETLLGGMQLGGGGQPPVLQQGQFKPSSAGLIDPTTQAKNTMTFLLGLDQLGSRSKQDPAISNVLQNVIQQLGGSHTAGRTNAPAVAIVQPPATREVGKTYSTPKGPMKWTGTGWVKP